MSTYITTGSISAIKLRNEILKKQSKNSLNGIYSEYGTFIPNNVISDIQCLNKKINNINDLTIQKDINNELFSIIHRIGVANSANIKLNAKLNKSTN